MDKNQGNIMPKLTDENIPQAGSFSFSPVRLEDEEGKTEIKNIESIIKRFKNYTKKVRGFVRPSWGIPPVSDISLEMFCTAVEYFIKDTLNSEPYRTVLYELNQYLVRKISYQINPQEILKSYNYFRVQRIIPLAEKYLNEFYKGKEIQKGDRFEKSAVIVNIVYMLYMADYAIGIREIINKNDTDASYLWRETYEIGFLQGKMCLIESHLDKDMAGIHHKSMSSKAKDEDWKKRHAEMDKANQELDEFLREPLQKAKDKWERSHKLIYHNTMADNLIEENKDLRIDREMLIEKLRPIAKEFRYSTFCGGEFKRPSDIIILCQSISKDNYKIKIHSAKNTIDWLNEIIMTPDFYSKWFKRKGDIDLSPELNELIGDTHSCRKKKFSELTEEEQIKIKRLNRLLLEHTYPRTPKSRKNGLMRGWDGKDTKERF